MDTHRNERVAEALRAELEELINYELNDPRVSNVAVTEVLVSPDLKKAHVRLSVEGSASEQVASVEAITNAKAYLRHQIAERLDMYRVPDLSFVPDLPGPMRDKALKLLKRIRKGRPKE